MLPSRFRGVKVTLNRQADAATHHAVAVAPAKRRGHPRHAFVWHALEKADVEADPGKSKWRGEKTGMVLRAQVFRGSALTHPTQRLCRRS